MRRILLASASPRRKQLLEQIGLAFEVVPSNHDERLDTALEPHEMAKALSREKAEAVAVNYKDALLIAADTFVVLEGRIIGKPKTEAEACEILAALSGKPHRVITGFTLVDTTAQTIVSQSVETIVYMKPLTPKQIKAYVATQEPLDKAGAYGIQGLGALLVDRIEGDYFNVIGLPLSALADSLAGFGIDLL